MPLQLKQSTSLTIFKCKIRSVDLTKFVKGDAFNPSSTSGDYIIPRTIRKLGERAFSVSAPSLWNALPSDINSTQCTTTFKKLLKTHLFKTAYYFVNFISSPGDRCKQKTKHTNRKKYELQATCPITSSRVRLTRFCKWLDVC